MTEKKVGKNPKQKKTRTRGNGQGSVYEYRKGQWRWQITLGYKPDGKRITATGTARTKTLANAAMTSARTDYQRGMLSEPDKVTVTEYVERWLTRKHDIKPRSVVQYRYALGYAMEVIGSMKVRDVRAKHLKDLVVTLTNRVMTTGKTMDPVTSGGVVTLLRAVFREAVGDQIIYVNPMDGVKRPRNNKTPEEKVGTAYDFHELARFNEIGSFLYKHNAARLFPALFMAASVGLRRGEILGLTWEHVDFERGLLLIRQQRTLNHEVMTLATPKTKHSRRDIHMPDSLRRILLEQHDRQKKEREQAGSEWIETGAVFATEFGNWVHPDNLNRAMNTLRAWSDPSAFTKRARSLGRLGIRHEERALFEAIVRSGDVLPALRVHDLRHTYATLALRRRVPVEVVSKTLGHAKVSITLDIYRDVIESEQLEHIIDLFEQPSPTRNVAVPALN